MGFAKEDTVKLQDTDLSSSHAHAQVQYLHLQDRFERHDKTTNKMMIRLY